MALQKLQFRPGLNREGTDYSNEGGWYDADKVRFRSGFPEKIGGWRRYATTQFLGLARALWNWVATNANNYLGIGTNVKYYVELGGFFFDVTPIVYTSTNVAAPVFYTTVNSATITVVDASYHPSVGDYFIISGANTIANTAITSTILNAEHVVTSLVNATAYTFAVSTTATNTANGGGSTVTIQYEYPVGLDVAIVGTGWGSGPWSRGTWGSAFNGGVQNQLRLWTNDNYGDLSIYSPSWWRSLLLDSSRYIPKRNYCWYYNKSTVFGRPIYIGWLQWGVCAKHNKSGFSFGYSALYCLYGCQSL
jgi:hypothetical protein